NLNRMFPGNKDGSYTEQLASVLLEQFLSRADAYIDLHSGDLVEALHPFSSYGVTGIDKVDGVAEQMARAFGFETIIRFSAKDRGSMTHVAAALRGVPSLLAEVGGQGVWRENDVTRFTRGIHSVMSALGMIDRSDETTVEIRTYNRFDWHFADDDGLWYPSVSVGDEIAKGQQVGEVRDVFGAPIQQVVAGDDGLNVFMLSALSARTGDPLIGIAADLDS
ncbi:MAG: succinylglutamate desuccinylase, partial [Rhodothermales bacterium]|nr:succinylglutamate desuccinylase [Rhodothermales bacterium]